VLRVDLSELIHPNHSITC